MMDNSTVLGNEKAGSIDNGHKVGSELRNIIVIFFCFWNAGIFSASQEEI